MTTPSAPVGELGEVKATAPRGTVLDGELTPQDVDDYTDGRLPAGDDETQRMLDAALQAARRDVFWHVSPIWPAHSITLDGPGGYKLRLPTKRIGLITSITNDGIALDPLVVTRSAEVPWLLVRNDYRPWSCRYSGVSITFDDGFDPPDAQDWRQAILSMVDQMVTIIAVGRPDADAQQKQVDDAIYRWGASQALPGAAPILEKYRLETIGV